MPKQKVIVVMGSKRDLDFAAPIGRLLEGYGVDYEFRVASAHRTPEHLMKILKEIKTDGADSLTR